MTAQEKIREAEYRLNGILNAPLDVVQFEVSPFLTATHSIYDHLLQDFANRFALGIIPQLNTGSFEQKARKLKNVQAEKFITWYRAEKKVLVENNRFGFLFDLRHIDVHRQVPKTILRLETKGPMTFSAGTTTEIPIVFTPLGHEAKVEGISKNGTREVGKVEAKASTIAFFEGHPDIDIVTVCTEFLNAAKAFVSLAYKLYG